MSTRIKTLKGWERSGVYLGNYLSEPCRINEALANYIGECTAPKYCSSEFIQAGEPERTEDGVSFHITVFRRLGVYWYIGILPEFKQ